LSRFFILALVFFAFLPTARGDDTIAPETIDMVKKATVFIRVDGDSWGITGSGFAITADDKSVLVATNKHVAVPSLASSRDGEKSAKISVIFDSGTKTERSYSGTVVSSDAERDLAVLRVTGVKDPPKPITYTEQPKLFETMPVYTFGFPFGKALSTNKGSPAVTVGKASISSLRNGTDGELAVVQIDGNLNPGNSGGPVVDTKGRLIGVAVATIRDGQGIGLTIPAAELDRMMLGRLGRLRVTPKKAMDTVTIRIEVDLIDPLEKIRSVTAHYYVVEPKAKRPETEALDKHPGSKKLEMKIEKSVGAAEFTVPKTEGEVLVQVTAAPAGKSALVSKVRTLSLAPTPMLADFAGTPPSGWKEYTPRDKTFTMWVPEKPAKQSDQERNIIVKAQRIKVNSMEGKTASGLIYEAQSVLLPASFIKVPRKDLYEMFRGGIVAETKGRITESKEIQMGTLSGAEYLVDADGTITRVRMSITGARVYIVQVTGDSDEVSTVEAETLLSSYRLPGTAVAKKEPNESTTPMPKSKTPAEVTTPTPMTKGKASNIKVTILGGAFDSEFKDVSPEGGLLIGFEIGFGKFANRDMIRAAKPIYRVGDKEVFGEQYGTQVTNKVTLKAKEGYAVGAISVKHGLGFDGMSITFMKVADGTLDATETYDSEFVGSDENKPTTRIGGSGKSVIGIVGKSNNKDMTGMGLLFEGEEGYEPKLKKK